MHYKTYKYLIVKILGDILKCWIIFYIRIESKVYFTYLFKEGFNHFVYILPSVWGSIWYFSNLKLKRFSHQKLIYIAGFHGGVGKC